MSEFSLREIGIPFSKGKFVETQKLGDTRKPQMCGDIDIRIARDGNWYYLGSPIGRAPLVKLFASALRGDYSGDFLLITPAEMCRITVDDAPFNAVEMTVNNHKHGKVLNFRLNIDEIVTAGPDHPIRVEIDDETGEPAPYILVRDGLEALIVRSVYYDLVEIGEERCVDGKTMLGVISNGMFFELGSLGDA